MLGAQQGPWIRKIAFIWSQVHLVVEPALFAKALCNLGNKWVLWMIECFVFRIYPDQTDFSETSENAKCFWCSFAFLPFCPRNFANVLLDLYSERLSLTRLENVIPAGIFTFPSRLLCKISSRTKQWILPGRKVSSGKPRVHLQAAVVAHPIASLISKTKPLPKSNGFNFQRRIPCRPSVSDFHRFLTPWHHWLQQDPTEPHWALLKTERLDAVPNLRRLHRIGSKFRTAF